MSMKIIRKILGELSRPANLMVDSIGGYWVDSYSVANDDNFKPLTYKSWTDYGIYKVYPYKFLYTGMKQNKWGWWILADCYLGKHVALNKYFG